MILVASGLPTAQTCAHSITRACGQQVAIAATAKEFAAMLRQSEYRLIVVDQLFADSNPRSMDVLWRNCRSALPVFVNMAIASSDRVVADCRAALERREREQDNARKQAGESLRSELTGSVTGILLSSELALAEPELPESLKNRLRSVHEMALDIKNRLESVA